MAIDPNILTKPLPPLTEEYMRELFGDPVEDARRSREYAVTYNYSIDHAEEIAAKYPNRFVAIDGCRVAYDAATLRELIAMVQADPTIGDPSPIVEYIKARPAAVGAGT